MPVVTETVLLPDGITPAAGSVTVELVGAGLAPIEGYALASDFTVVGRKKVELTAAGVWSTDLVPNARITPAGTVWRITRATNGAGGTAVVSVPDGAGPYRVEDILTDPPTAIESSALATERTARIAGDDALDVRVDALEASGGGGHPTLAIHDSMGLATQAELDAHTGLTTGAHGGLVAGTDARLSDARTPTGAAGGVLAGTYPNPSFSADMATQAELDAHGHTTVPVSTVATAAYTLALADGGKVVRMTFAGASTLTVPANATVPFAIGTVLNPYAAGGALTIAGAAGVTIRNNAGSLAQYGECSLRKDGTDEWVRVG